MTQPSATTTYDWSRFDVHMDYHAPADAVYDAWATARGMASFFARTFRYLDERGRARDDADRAAAGDPYELACHHPSTLEGRVLETDPPRHFAFSFGPRMRVDVTVEPHDGFTRLRLVQSDIPTDDAGRVESHLNCRSCWIYYLLNLKSVLEHDADLRDPDRPDNVVSVHFGRSS